MAEPTGPFQKIVIDQDICIGCGACVAVCPYQAIEMNVHAKAELLSDKCKDSFDCIPVCPVTCIWKSDEAPAESKKKSGWYKVSKQLSPDEQKLQDEWKGKHGIVGNPA